MADEEQQLEQVVARNMRVLRQEREWSQADLATYMRFNGFKWTANRVAQLETLRRPVSLLELIGLSWTFGVAVTRLLDGDDRVALPNGESVALERMRQALTGEQGSTVRRITAAEKLAARDQRDDLRRIAQRLSLTVRVLDRLSRELWGHGLVEEREKRLGGVEGLSAGSVQTRRGHITRALIGELEKHLGDADRAQLVEEEQRETKAYLDSLKGGEQ